MKADNFALMMRCDKFVEKSRSLCYYEYEMTVTLYSEMYNI